MNLTLEIGPNMLHFITHSATYVSFWVLCIAWSMRGTSKYITVNATDNNEIKLDK